MKWYDVIKGYGFVVPDKGGPDIMIHASCVRAFGRMALSDNTSVRLVAAQGERGLHAVELLEVDEAPEAEASPDAPAAGPSAAAARPTEFLDAEAATGPLRPARVKWFDKQKGFGFVNIFGEPEDVFVHMEIVRRCGFPDLASGEGMAVRTFRGPRGLMVAELRLWEAATEPAEKAAMQDPAQGAGPRGVVSGG